MNDTLPVHVIDLTLQDAFDTVVSHLAQQGQRCVQRSPHGGDQCRYRGPDGRKCAFGIFIPDSHYDVAMEGYAVEKIAHPSAYRIDIPDRPLRRLLYRLQSAHDGSHSLDDVQRALSEAAEAFKLDQSLVASITRWVSCADLTSYIGEWIDGSDLAADATPEADRPSSPEELTDDGEE